MLRLSSFKVTTTSVSQYILQDATVLSEYFLQDSTAFNFTQNNAAAFNASGAEASSGVYFPTTSDRLTLKLGNGLFLDDFDNFNNLSLSDSSNLLNEYGAVKINYNIYTGDGADGNITITGAKNINTDVISTNRIRPDAISFNVINLTATTARLSTIPVAGDLTVGDEILLINVQGTSSNYTNTGNYETLRIKSIASDIITFTTEKIKKYGSGSSDDLNIGTTSSLQRVLLQRVPNYNNVTIDLGNTLTANSQDGTKGGILFFRVAGTLVLYGTITMTGKGYRGGSSVGYFSNGLMGESIGGNWNVKSTSANIGGGGGGLGGESQNGGTSGGGAGYGTVGTNGGAGVGGSLYGDNTISKLYIGSAGGSGGCGGGGYYDEYSGAGGTGGGVVAIFSNNFNCSGTVTTSATNGASGGNGFSFTGGGGGTGGTLFTKVKNLTIGTSTITSTGSSGSGGGAGGQGRIAMYYQSLSGTISTNPTSYSSATSPINTSSRLVSSKVLDYHVVNTINDIEYRLSALPYGSSVKIQVSQDKTSQYDVNGNLNQQTPMTIDKTSISFTDLSNQSGTNFYYRIDMSSDGNDSPVLDRIIINYDPDAYSPSEQYQQSHVIDSNIGARIVTLLANQTIDQSDKIPPKIQILASNTGSFLGEETIFPAGIGSYYQNGNTYSINNNVSLNIQQQIGFNFYRYQKIKVFLDAGNQLTDSPILNSIGFTGILQTDHQYENLIHNTLDVTSITKNTSFKIIEKTVSVTNSVRYLVVAELELDNTGYDFSNGGTTTNMQISRDGTQLHEKLEMTHLHKGQYQKTIVDVPPVGEVKYQVYAAEIANKCDSRVVKCSLRIYNI